MSKRRTKKEKQKAIHHFSLSWENKAKNPEFKATVKRQFGDSLETPFIEPDKVKSAKGSAKDESLSVIKRNILKSLIIVSLILALELVIYLVWRV